MYEAHLLRRTYREGGKVKNETLANLSRLPRETIELVRRSLRGGSECDAQLLRRSQQRPPSAATRDCDRQQRAAPRRGRRVTQFGHDRPRAAVSS